jgi:O-antigen/teichoic acid export membrane protein
LNTALTVFFLGRGYGILALAIIGFSCALLSNIFFYLISKHCFPALKVRWRYFDRTLVRSLMGYSMWSFLSNISIIMKFRLHSVIIASVMGATAVTHFVVGSRLADYFRELLLQATNLTMPVLTKYHTLQQTEQLRDKLLLLTKINTILACFGAGMTIMLGKAFIATWMGAEYMDAYPVLVVLVLAMAVEVMLDPARGAMFSMGHNRFMGVFELVEAALTVIICVVLIRYYGILGVALGTAIPLFLLKLTIVPKVVSDRVDMDWRRFYRSMVPCFLITTVFLLIYGWFAIHYLLADAYLNLLTAGALSVALYAPVVFYLILDKSEVALLMKLVPLRKATLGVVQK